MKGKGIDLSREEDLSIAIMNLICLAEDSYGKNIAVPKGFEKLVREIVNCFKE